MTLIKQMILFVLKVKLINSDFKIAFPIIMSEYVGGGFAYFFLS